jgi:hypothetical protein
MAANEPSIKLLLLASRMSFFLFLGFYKQEQSSYGVRYIFVCWNLLNPGALWLMVGDCLPQHSVGASGLQLCREPQYGSIVMNSQKDTLPYLWAVI